jgi:hypothetical protein
MDNSLNVLVFVQCSECSGYEVQEDINYCEECGKALCMDCSEAGLDEFDKSLCERCLDAASDEAGDIEDTYRFLNYWNR